jgi:hypothetical protein
VVQLYFKRINMKVPLSIILALLVSACGESEPATSTVCIFGDSTTKRNPYLPLTEAGISFVAIGPPGARVDHLVDGRNYYFQKSYTEELRGNCSTIVLNFGLNDVGSGRYTAESFSKTLKAMRDEGQAAGKRVILETPNPTSEPTAPTLVGYAQAVRDLGGEVVDNHALFGGVFKPEWMADAAHPNQLGYYRKADNLRAVLKNIDK